MSINVVLNTDGDGKAGLHSSPGYIVTDDQVGRENQCFQMIAHTKPRGHETN